MRHTEAIQIEAPAPTMQAQSLNGEAGYSTFEQEWPDFGAFRDDPTLDELFDDIERRRDAHPIALKSAANSFRQGWQEARRGETSPVETLWDDNEIRTGPRESYGGFDADTQ
jgi:hypothetical protein